MARERGAVAGIVSRVVHGFDVRETREIDEACAQDRRENGGGQALAQGGGAGDFVRVAAGAGDD